MQTIDNIVFDDVIYPRANPLALLLYQMRGPSLFIPLPNAHLMSFIEVFADTRRCDNHITANNRKEIILFTFENNMQWLIGNSYLDSLPHVQKVHIFCSSQGTQQFWTTWSRRYRGTIEKPFLYQDLDFKLLYFGCNHIEEVCQQFSDDHGVTNILKEDLKKISEALANYYQQKANIQDDKIRQSNEVQN